MLVAAILLDAVISCKIKLAMENIKEYVDKLMADETVKPTDKKDLLIGWISKMYDKIATTPMGSHDLCEANMCVEYMRTKHDSIDA